MTTSTTLSPKINEEKINSCMSNFIITFSNISREAQENLKNKVILMNGKVEKHLFRRVTHIVSDSWTTKKCIFARRNRYPQVMTTTWIEECWKNHLINHQDFKLPIFHGFNLCFSQLPKSYRPQFGIFIKQNGGEYSGAMDLTKTTHLVCWSKVGEKYERAKTIEGIKIVNYRWFLKSIQDGIPLEESLFPPNDSTKLSNDDVNDLKKDFKNLLKNFPTLHSQNQTKNHKIEDSHNTNASTDTTGYISANISDINENNSDWQEKNCTTSSRLFQEQEDSIELQNLNKAREENINKKNCSSLSESVSVDDIGLGSTTNTLESSEISLKDQILHKSDMKESTNQNNSNDNLTQAPLSGYFIYLSRCLKPRRRELHSLIQELGGVPVDIIDRLTTHVVIEGENIEYLPEYKRAVKLSIQIVDIAWLTGHKAKDYETKRPKSFTECFRDFQIVQKRKNIFSDSNTNSKKICTDSSKDAKKEAKERSVKKSEELEELLKSIEPDIEVNIEQQIIETVQETCLRSKQLILNPSQASDNIPGSLPVVWDASEN